MKYEQAAYLCDGHGCKKNCADTLTEEEWAKYGCHHTKDETHAKNKCRRSRKMKMHKNGQWYEVE